MDCYYDNYSTDVTLHDQECHCYRNRQADQTDNGRWVSGFSTPEEAERNVPETNRPVNWCSKCSADRATG